MTIYVTRSIGCGDLYTCQETGGYCPKSCWDSGDRLLTLFGTNERGDYGQLLRGRANFAIYACYHPFPTLGLLSRLSRLISSPAKFTNIPYSIPVMARPVTSGFNRVGGGVLVSVYTRCLSSKGDEAGDLHFPGYPFCVY